MQFQTDWDIAMGPTLFFATMVARTMRLLVCNVGLIKWVVLIDRFERGDIIWPGCLNACCPTNTVFSNRS